MGCGVVDGGPGKRIAGGVAHGSGIAGPPAEEGYLLVLARAVGKADAGRVGGLLVELHFAASRGAHLEVGADVVAHAIVP